MHSNVKSPINKKIIAKSNFITPRKVKKQVDFYVLIHEISSDLCQTNCGIENLDPEHSLQIKKRKKTCYE